MTGKILDFNCKKKDKVEKKRRGFERLLFQNFLGIYSVVRRGEVIYPVDLVDVSPQGCLFQIPSQRAKEDRFEVGGELTLRVYFTEFSYLTVVVHIRHSRKHLSQDGVYYQQYGCEFDQSLSSFQAMSSFIDFLYQFAQYSSVDRGDKKVSFV